MEPKYLACKEASRENEAKRRMKHFKEISEILISDFSNVMELFVFVNCYV